VKLRGVILSLMAVPLLLISTSRAQETWSLGVVVARGELREQIKSTPILERLLSAPCTSTAMPYGAPITTAHCRPPPSVPRGAPRRRRQSSRERPENWARRRTISLPGTSRRSGRRVAGGPFRHLSSIVRNAARRQDALQNAGGVLKGCCSQLHLAAGYP